MYFAVITKEEDGEVYLEDYIEAASSDAARLKAIEMYGPLASIKYAIDEEAAEFFAERDKEREEEWRKDAELERKLVDPYGNQIGEPDVSQAAKLPVDYKEKLNDEEIRFILSKGRPLDRKRVTKSQVRKVKGEILYSKCVDCGVNVPYRTRPHERCEKCRKKHDSERKRLERLK